MWARPYGARETGVVRGLNRQPVSSEFAHHAAAVPRGHVYPVLKILELASKVVYFQRGFEIFFECEGNKTVLKATNF